MKLKKCNRVWILFILVFGVNTPIKSQSNDVNQSIEFSSIKLRMSFGGFYNEFIINPNYCIIVKQREYSFGVVYRDMHYKSLHNYKHVDAFVKSYGIKLGYINNVKNIAKVKLRFETDFVFAFSKSHEIRDDEYWKRNNVYSAGLVYGPNLNIPIMKDLNMNLLLQISMGYGIDGSNSYVPEKHYPSGFNIDPYYFIDINYLFDRR